MNQTQRENLTKLADGLLKIQEAIDVGVVDKNIFNINEWKVMNSKEIDLNKEGFDCGFAGCAIGWAPKFIKDFPFTTREPTEWERPHLMYGGIRYRAEYSFRQIADYFGLEGNDVHDLFDPNYYSNHPSPKDVSIKIRGVLEKYPC